jgi:hypothetical protein
LLLTAAVDAGSGDTAMAAWNIDTGEALDRFSYVGPADVACLAVADDGSRVGVGNRRAQEFRTYAATPLTQQAQQKAPLPSLLSFAPDGQQVWCVAEDETIVQYSLPELAEQWRWSNADFVQLLGRGGFLSLAVGRQRVLGGTSSGQLISLAPGAQGAPRMWKAPAAVTSVVLDRNETQAFFGTADGDVLQVQLPDGTNFKRLGKHARPVSSIVWIEGEGLVATSSRDMTVQIWRQRARDFEKVLTLRATGPIDRLRATADGSRLIAHIQGESALRVWRLDLLRSRLREMNLDW